MINNNDNDNDNNDKFRDSCSASARGPEAAARGRAADSGRPAHGRGEVRRAPLRAGLPARSPDDIPQPFMKPRQPILNPVISCNPKRNKYDCVKSHPTATLHSLLCDTIKPPYSPPESTATMRGPSNPSKSTTPLYHPLSPLSPPTTPCNPLLHPTLAPPLCTPPRPPRCRLPPVSRARESSGRKNKGTSPGPWNRVGMN